VYALRDYRMDERSCSVSTRPGRGRHDGRTSIISFAVCPLIFASLPGGAVDILFSYCITKDPTQCSKVEMMMTMFRGKAGKRPRASGPFRGSSGAKLLDSPSRNSLVNANDVSQSAASCLVPSTLVSPRRLSVALAHIIPLPIPQYTLNDTFNDDGPPLRRRR
jgi:hypothetical protein